MIGSVRFAGGGRSILVRRFGESACCLAAGALLLAAASLLSGADENSSKSIDPPGCLQRLCSEIFQERESAQKELLDWARSGGEPAVASLVGLVSGSGDPEIRSRCFEVLREIAMDDFFSQGEGYIGINMEDVFVTVPGDPNQRVGIRVGIVMKDSAASDAGLRVGDVIVGLGDEIWREIPIREKFGRQIRELKPKSKVNLKVFRGGKLVDIDVTLRRRPPIPMGLPLLDDSPVDLEALLKAEQEEFFRNWLKAKQLKK